MNYYEVLNINVNASPEEIKRSFKILAKKYHPDHNKEPGAKELFSLVYEAYSILIDHDKRKNHTIMIKADELAKARAKAKAQVRAQAEKRLMGKKAALAQLQVILANRYTFGNGTPVDYDKAFEWYSKAAELGNAEAQYHIGVCFHLGRGVPKDHAKAVEWYCKAAEQGIGAAQFSMGNCFHWGYRVKQDYAKAAEWYGKAAMQGWPLAQDALDKLRAEGKI